MDNLCKYGCGREGKYKFRNGLCCEDSPNKCPANRQKNSDATKQSNTFKIRSQDILKSCQFCGTTMASGNISRHEHVCYLNPNRLILCPVCGKPIKNYKKNKTCSHGCANTFFRTGKNNPNWKDSTYRTTCFEFHPRRCIVCGEENIVEVHHYDGNRDNNEPQNLIPLCPTHHKYVHSRHNEKVEEYIEEYRKNYINPTLSELA